MKDYHLVVKSRRTILLRKKIHNSPWSASAQTAMHTKRHDFQTTSKKCILSGCCVVCIAWLSMLLSLTANCQKLGFFSTRVFLLIFLVKKTPELIQIQDLKKFPILDDQQEQRVLCTRYDTTFRRQAKMHIRQDVVSFRVHSHLCIAFPMGLSVTPNGDHFREWLRCGKILKTTFDKS